MTGLFKYYQSMGFTVDNEDTFEKDLKRRVVPMSASFEKISDECYRKTGFKIKDIPVTVTVRKR